MTPQSILDFIKETVEGTHHLSDGAIAEKQENVSAIIDSLIEGNTVKNKYNKLIILFCEAIMDGLFKISLDIANKSYKIA